MKLHHDDKKFLEPGMSSPAKPSLEEVRAFLAKHQALVVHCSGTPKGIGPGQEPYPADLQNVWQGHAQGGISCSVVKPGDHFHGSARNSTGSVGLVIASTASNSLVAVAPNDAGSYVVNGARVVAHEVDIEIADLERSLSARDDRYNEWVVRDFKVVGVFVAEPATTWQEVPIPVPSDLGVMPPQLISQDVGIAVSEITADFKGLPIYTLSEDEILRWTVNGWSTVAHSDIYSAIHEENYKPVIKQHVLPAALIRRFFSAESSCVNVFFRVKGKIFSQGDSWREFVEFRKWDEQIEKIATVYEAAFLDLADLIAAGQDTLTPEENLVVTRYWNVISERSRARHQPLISEPMFEPITASTLPDTHLDFLERQGVLMAGTSEQMNRVVYGMAQRMMILKTARAQSSWRVVRASEGQFLVSDNYHHAQLVPINPTTYLAPGKDALRLGRASVEEFNKSLLAASERYVFAQNLSECGVSISAPSR
jgi:hypothetical protein